VINPAFEDDICSKPKMIWISHADDRHPNMRVIPSHSAESGGVAYEQSLSRVVTTTTKTHFGVWSQKRPLAYTPDWTYLVARTDGLIFSLRDYRTVLMQEFSNNLLTLTANSLKAIGREERCQISARSPYSSCFRNVQTGSMTAFIPE
jgi:hypothetical protein